MVVVVVDDVAVVVVLRVFQEIFKGNSKSSFKGVFSGFQ